MKFIKFIVCAIVALVAFTSCSSNNDEPATSNSLVGIWEMVDTEDSCSDVTYTFNSDMTGTFKEVDRETGETYEYEYFTYVYNTETNKGVISFDDDPDYDTYVELLNATTIKITYVYPDDEDEYDICVKK